VNIKITIIKALTNNFALIKIPAIPKNYKRPNNQPNIHDSNFFCMLPQLLPVFGDGGVLVIMVFITQYYLESLQW